VPGGCDTLSVVNALAEVLAAWPLESVGEATEIRAGATNQVYRVECASRVVFLRIYRRPDVAMAHREHALIRHVREQGVPAPLPLPALTGDTVVEYAGQVAALYEAARGAQLEPGTVTHEQAYGAGHTLAQIHRATAPLADAGYTPRDFAWDGSEWVERLNAVERAIRARGSGSTSDAWALQRLEAQRGWLRQPQCVHSAPPQCSPQVIHGDYHDANLFFEGDQVSAVIDWEQAAFLPRAYEVVRACHFMFRMAPEPTQAFLAGYRTLSPLGQAELGDGAASWGCYADHHVWPLEEVFLHGNERARRFIPHAPFVPFAEAWQRAMAAG